MIVFSGDIGGTFARFKVCKILNSDFKTALANPLVKVKYKNANFKSFKEVLADFITNHCKDFKIDKACVGVAGPCSISDDTNYESCRITNLLWHISRKDIADQLQISLDKIKLINDFSANCYGVFLLEDYDIHSLNKGKKSNHESLIALIGAGTGLGMGQAFKDKSIVKVFHSEGGHQNFSPTNDLQIRLLKFLQDRNHRTVSQERVCCGLGILNIYKFLIYDGLKPSIKLLDSLSVNKDHTKIICDFAKREDEEIAKKTVEIFTEIYGSIAGNLALVSLPTQGLFITGGLSLHLLDFLKNEDLFLKNFLDKGRFKDVLSDIPVNFIIKDDLGLDGAMFCAFNL